MSQKEIDDLLKISGNSREHIEKFADAFLIVAKGHEKVKYVPSKLKKEILKLLKRSE